MIRTWRIVSIFNPTGRFHFFSFIITHQQTWNIKFKVVCIFCCNAALRTTRGSLSVCMYVCLCVCMSVCMSLLAFLPLTQKIFKHPIPQNLWSYATFFSGGPYEKKKIKNFVYEGVQHFLDTKYKIIFLLLSKKSFSKP